MFVSGVPLSASAVATLARCLQRDDHVQLAEDLGLALDAGRSELRLAPGEEEEILAVLDDCPAQLQGLREALRANSQRRDESAN